jgi:hypothetical protein
MPSFLTRADLSGDLVRLGIAPGDIVMVHAALSKIGNVLGGPDAVIGALRDAASPEGAVAAYCDWDASYEELLDENGRVPEKWRKHVPPLRLAAEEHAAQIEIHDLVPLGLGRDMLDRKIHDDRGELRSKLLVIVERVHLVLRSEDLFERPSETYTAVLRFLGVTTEVPFPEFVPHNPGEDEAVPPEARRVLTETYREPNWRLRDLVGIDFSQVGSEGSPFGGPHPTSW